MKHDIQVKKLDYIHESGLYVATFESNIAGCFELPIDSSDVVKVMASGRIDRIEEDAIKTTTTFLPPITRKRLAREDIADVVRDNLATVKEKKKKGIDKIDMDIE